MVMSVDNSVCFCLPERMHYESERILDDPIKLKTPIHCACLQKSNASNGRSLACHSGNNHEETKFYVCCKCPECLEYKQTIANMVKKELSSAAFWNLLKEILRDYYRVLFKNNSLLQEQFGDVHNVDCGWQESGSAFTTRLRHLDNTKFSREMKFVQCYSLLQADDSHQLLELLCSEAECIARTYSRGITDKRYNPSHSESELHKINYVLEGYQLICEISQKIEPLLFGFQNNYLDKFSLTWTLVIKRMYQKYVFDGFSENANQSLLKLKGEVSTRQYIEILTKYIALDDEMSCVKKTWKTVWDALNKYHMANEDIDRRNRVRKIRKTFEILNKIAHTEDQQEPLEGQNCPNMANDWENAIISIQKNWTKNNNSRMFATTRSEKCVSCKAWIDNHKTSCKCTTCLIGGPFFSNANQDLVKSLCFKCAVMQNAIPNTTKLPMFVDSLKNVLKNRNTDGNLLNKQIFEKYHLCWAVFKNRPGRRIFPDASISLLAFCENCDKAECMIAKKIINNELSLELANVILQYFHPLLINQNEAASNVRSVLDFFSEIRNKAALDFSSENFAEKIFFSFCISVLITQYIMVTKDESELVLDNLELRNGDIQLKFSLTLDSSLDNMMDQYDFLQVIPNLTLDADCAERRNCTLDTTNSAKIQHCSDSISSVKNGPRSQKKSSSGISQKTQKITQDELNHRNCIESWIKQTLNFIEEDKKEKGTNKKLEKRNRQKLKKEECKRIEELNTLKSEYQDVYFKEFFAKQELKNYKTLKKKDKKKIIETENYIRKMNSTKVKIEKNILHTLHIVKSTNPNFKLSYLPSKVELEDAMKKFTKLPEKDNCEKTSISSASEEATDINRYQDIVLDDGVTSAYFEASVMKNAAENAASMVQTSDPSKNIVTIRRVNIPHLSEPQVTVTAKGTSPKDDKLLYTFINGQIVPASRLEPKILRILSSPSSSILPKDVYTQFQEETNASELVKTINCCESSSCDNEALNVIQSGSEYNNFLNNEKAMGYPGGIVTTSTSNVYFKSHNFPENDGRLACDPKIKLVDVGESIPSVYRKDIRLSQNLTAKKSASNSEMLHEEHTANILCKSMKDLNISKNDNCRTDNNTGYNSTDSHWSWNISIMDQINKGVQVENLMLPPGITLTKIDPEKSEKVKAKRQSIDNLSYRMKCAKDTADLPDEVSVQLLPSPDVVSTSLESGFNKKKRRKNTSSKSSLNPDMVATHNHVERHRSLCETTKINSMFLNTSKNNTNRTLSKVEPAAIIKKENGMYTIRNPAMRNTNTLTTLPRIYSSAFNKSNDQERDKNDLRMFAVNEQKSAECRPVQYVGAAAMNGGIESVKQDTRFDGQSRNKTILSQRNFEHNPYPEVTIFNTSGNKNGQSSLNAADLKAYLSKSWNEEIEKPKSS